MYIEVMLLKQKYNNTVWNIENSKVHSVLQFSCAIT